MGGPSGPVAPQTYSRDHCSQEGGWSPSQERPYPRERASWAAVLGEDKHGLLTGRDVGAGGDLALCQPCSRQTTSKA